MNNLIWKDVVGYEEYFKVSSCGKVFSKRTNKLLKQHKNKNGYMQISTRLGGRKGKFICFKIHRLVAEAFLETPSQYQINSANNTVYGRLPVNHKDSDRTNNDFNNLEWATYSENTQHFATSSKGILSYKTRNQATAKLSDSDVRVIRDLYSDGVSQRKLAAMFNVTRTSIINAIKGYKWVT